MARKKPPADAPGPEPDQPEWRRPSVHRADQRNVVTYVDPDLSMQAKQSLIYSVSQFRRGAE